jgi:hypothetical protein
MKNVFPNEKLILAIVSAILIVIAVLAVFAARVTPEVTVIEQRGPSGTVKPAPEQPGEGEPTDGLGSPTDADACSQAGGVWNECGSACRGAPPDTVCIMMCVPYCECTSDAQCPDGLTCEEEIDGVGVCKKS